MAESPKLTHEEVATKIVAFEKISQAREYLHLAQWVVILTNLHVTLTLLNFGSEIYIAICASKIDVTRAEQLILPIFEGMNEVALRPEIVGAIASTHISTGGRGAWASDIPVPN